MSQAPFPVERYDTDTFGGGSHEVSLRGLPPGEAARLGPIFAGIDPWARLNYSGDALAGYLATIEKGAPRYGVMIGNEVAGAVGLRLNWLRGPYLQFLGILPAFQTRKLGSAVVAWLAHEAKRNGEPNVWVMTSDFNAGALRFYDRHGFGRSSEIADLVGPDTKEILLRRKL